MKKLDIHTRKGKKDADDYKNQQQRDHFQLG